MDFGPWTLDLGLGHPSRYSLRLSDALDKIGTRGRTMTLAELLEGRFRADIRFRGAAYFKAERVAVSRVTPNELFAIVRDGVEYQTQLSRHEGRLKLFCNCADGPTRFDVQASLGHRVGRRRRMLYQRRDQGGPRPPLRLRKPRQPLLGRIRRRGGRTRRLFRAADFRLGAADSDRAGGRSRLAGAAEPGAANIGSRTGGWLRVSPRTGDLLRDRHRPKPGHRPNPDPDIASPAAGKWAVGKIETPASADWPPGGSDRRRRRANPRLSFRRNARTDQLARAAGGNSEFGTPLSHPARVVRAHHAADVRHGPRAVFELGRKSVHHARMGRRTAVGALLARHRGRAKGGLARRGAALPRERDPSAGPDAPLDSRRTGPDSQAHRPPPRFRRLRLGNPLATGGRIARAGGPGA